MCACVKRPSIESLRENSESESFSTQPYNKERIVQEQREQRQFTHISSFTQILGVCTSHPSPPHYVWVFTYNC